MLIRIICLFIAGRRRNTIKKTEYILNCIDYYEHTNHGKQEKQKRYKYTEENEVGADARARMCVRV